VTLTLRIAALLTAVIPAAAIVTTTTAAARGRNPSSVKQALTELRHSVALGAGWSGFGTGSSVHARIHRVEGSDESTEILFKELAARSDDEVTIRYWDGEHREVIGDMRYSLDVPEFAESKATRLEDDAVPVGGKVHPAQVYQFERTLRILHETQTIRWTFWLAAGVSEGELRRVTESTSTDPTYGDNITDLKLTAMDVPIVVGRQTLHCHCRESEEMYIDGKIERVRSCSSAAVPGGVVLETVRVTENGKETQRKEYIVIDYHVEH
jgi:hypothetical protein